MAKMAKKKRRAKGAGFWDQEYTEAHHLKMSERPSEDLERFMRFVYRQKESFMPRQHVKVMDLGCGNGRNLIYLAKEVNARGIGYDISSAGIKLAKQLSEGLPITYTHRSIAGDLDVEDASQHLVLDMMTSHFLNKEERTHLRDEAARVLKPGGWLFMKTFLADGDVHTKRLLGEVPGKESGTYIHPVIGVPEYVYSEDELIDFLEERFIVHKVHKSHKHVIGKRRTISVYAQKSLY